MKALDLPVAVTVFLVSTSFRLLGVGFDVHVGLNTRLTSGHSDTTFDLFRLKVVVSNSGGHIGDCGLNEKFERGKCQPCPKCSVGFGLTAVSFKAR